MNLAHRNVVLTGGTSGIGRKLGSVDVLINNAAVQFEPAFSDPGFRYASIAQEIAVNFTAVCALTSLLRVAPGVARRIMKAA